MKSNQERGQNGNGCGKSEMKDRGLFFYGSNGRLVAFGTSGWVWASTPTDVCAERFVLGRKGTGLRAGLMVHLREMDRGVCLGKGWTWVCVVCMDGHGRGHGGVSLPKKEKTLNIEDMWVCVEQIMKSLLQFRCLENLCCFLSLPCSSSSPVLVFFFPFVVEILPCLDVGNGQPNPQSPNRNRSSDQH